MDMIELIATAIASNYDDLTPKLQRSYRQEAIRILKAMREPTKKMKQIAISNYETDSGVWGAMIDEALEETS